MSKPISVKDYKMHMLLKSNNLNRKHWQHLVPTLKLFYVTKGTLKGHFRKYIK